MRRSVDLIRHYIARQRAWSPSNANYIVATLGLVGCVLVWLEPLLPRAVNLSAGHLKERLNPSTKEAAGSPELLVSTQRAWVNPDGHNRQRPLAELA